MKRCTLILALACVATHMQTAAAADSKPFKGVRDKLVVQADPQHVWQVIRALRNDDPGDVKTISQTPTENILEETFDDLPIIGKAKCRYRETYTPFEKIEYRMISSDHFKAFEGSWVLTPVSNGSKTVVELSSYVDTGLVVPFVHQLTNLATARNVRGRLEDVKKAVESRLSRGGSTQSLSQSSL